MKLNLLFGFHTFELSSSGRCLSRLWLAWHHRLWHWFMLVYTNVHLNFLGQQHSKFNRIYELKKQQQIAKKQSISLPPSYVWKWEWYSHVHMYFERITVHCNDSSSPYCGCEMMPSLCDWKRRGTKSVLGPRKTTSQTLAKVNMRQQQSE